MFFDVGKTHFEQTPVYRPGFETTMLLNCKQSIQSSDNPLFITNQGKSDQSGKAFLDLYGGSKAITSNEQNNVNFRIPAI